MTYVTDPACPWSWAAEPALAALRHRLEPPARVELVMGGLAREFGPGSDQALAWLEAGAWSGMPVDPRLWLTGRGPRSSYPACVSITAAAEQSEAAAAGLLRRLRVGLACRGEALDTPQALETAARDVPGLDLARFAVDLRSHAILERFGAQLERARAGDGALPALELRGPGGEARRLAGPRIGVEAALAAAREVGVALAPRPPAPEEVLRAAPGPVGVPEVAAACDLAGPRAPAELWRLAEGWRARAERVGAGELWAPA